MAYPLEHHFVTLQKTSGPAIRLHVVQAGPTNGPLILLLHGFPEFWYGWKKQIGPLTKAGFRVWVPDQRGYNLSDKPADINAYTIDLLSADIISLIDAAGRQKATVVGHDWGAAVAWWTAATHPERVERLVVLNVPHPAIMKRFASRNLAQMLRSWYIGFFQIPALPEAVLERGHFWALTSMMQSSSRPGTFSMEDLTEYRAAWALHTPTGKRALSTMINWYRAALQNPPKRDLNLRITVPTTLLWGVNDRFLIPEMAQPSLDLCLDGKLIFFKHATHWLQHEEPEQITNFLIEQPPKNP